MAHDDFAVEAARGLAKKLPKGERILWQGSPVPWALAKAALKVHWVIGYFALLAVWRGLALAATDGVLAGAGAVVWYVLAGAAAVAVIMAMAFVMARAAVYTITSARVVMRIGAALTVSLNLPLKHVASADLAAAKDGTGSISLSLKGETRFAYLVLWPHARPWTLRQPQPTLRAIPNVVEVAEILAAAAAETTGAVVSRFDVVEDRDIPQHAIPAE